MFTAGASLLALILLKLMTRVDNHKPQYWFIVGTTKVCVCGGGGGAAHEVNTSHG